MKSLLDQIEIASRSHSDLSLIELIEFVCDAKYPSKVCKQDTFSRQLPKWTLSNYDILQAFKQHNKLRQNDKQAANS